MKNKVIFHCGTSLEDILLRIRGFVDHFFGCDYCREHFLEARRWHQVIAISHAFLAPEREFFEREMGPRLFQGNLDFGNIIIWPESFFLVIFMLKRGLVATFRWLAFIMCSFRLIKSNLNKLEGLIVVKGFGDKDTIFRIQPFTHFHFF